MGEYDQARAKDIEELRERLRKEREDHRDQINRFRYDFDDLVHLKIEKLIELIENIHRMERKDDIEQKEQIAQLHVEIRSIKENVMMVAQKWGRFASNHQGRKSLKEVTAGINQGDNPTTPADAEKNEQGQSELPPEDRDGPIVG